MRRCKPLASSAQLHYNHDMSVLENEEHEEDDLLAAEELRLPEGANTLVRLHALRAWLERRRTASELEIGTAALAMQAATSEPERRPRRRREDNDAPLTRAQAALSQARLRQSAYDEASTLLEECIAHTTTGERLLVEYYLSLEELIAAGATSAQPPWREAMQDVLHRIEQVGSPDEETA